MQLGKVKNKVIVDCERMKYPFTGLYYYCLHLAKNLQQTNPANRALCFYTRPQTETVFENSCTVEQHSLHKFLLPSLKPFSIWHATFQGTMYYPWRRKIKVVLTVHDLNFLYDESKTKAKKQKYLKQLAAKIKRADHVVAISNFVLQDIEKHISLKGKPHSVIYNGCTITEIENLVAPAAAPDVPFLFAVGTIVDKKNFHVLPGLLQQNNYQLIIAGVTNSEEYKQKIIETAAALGVQDRVVFAGPVSENDKQWYLKNCVAFVFPSIAEGFGLPVIEALYFEKPVLLSNHTSLPEIGGDAAYYFKNFEPAHMQQVLVDALNHFDLNNGGPKAKQRALLFDWRKSAEQYHEVYDSLLSEEA